MYSRFYVLLKVVIFEPKRISTLIEPSLCTFTTRISTTAIPTIPLLSTVDWMLGSTGADCTDDNPRFLQFSLALSFRKVYCTWQEKVVLRVVENDYPRKTFHFLWSDTFRQEIKFLQQFLHFQIISCIHAKKPCHSTAPSMNIKNMGRLMKS